MSQRAWQVFPAQAGHTFCTGPESSGNPAHTPPCRCPGCSTHQKSGTRSHCRFSARSARYKGFKVWKQKLSIIIVFCCCHLVVLLTDELVEECEVGAVKSVPAHRAGHAVFMVIFSTGYHAVSDNRPAADATCSLLALTGDLLDICTDNCSVYLIWTFSANELVIKSDYFTVNDIIAVTAPVMSRHEGDWRHSSTQSDLTHWVW